MKEVKLVKTLEEALNFINQGYCFYGGGTEINRLNSKVQVTKVVALSFEKKPVYVESNMFVMPLGTTFEDVVLSKDAPSYLKKAASFMASRPKREMASVAGNVYLHRCDSYLVSTLRAAKAQIVLDSNQELCICSYLKDFDSYKNRIIVAIKVPMKVKIASVRIANTLESHAVLTAAANADSEVFASMKFWGLIENPEGDYAFKSDIYGSPEYKNYLLKTITSQLREEVKA